MTDKNELDQTKEKDRLDAMRVEGKSRVKADESDAISTDDKDSKYEQWTTNQLHDKADELNISEHADMKRDKLIKVLRNH